jgi:peptidoglycan hydrolase-like protein with peptidoglycan-binding domain
MTDLDNPADSVAMRLGRRADSLQLSPAAITTVHRRARQRSRRRATAVGATGVVAAAALVAVRLEGYDTQRIVVPVDTTVAGTPSTSTSTSSSTPFPGTPLRRGDAGTTVADLQQRLTDLGFDPGPVDGQFGALTEQAVWAFEGLALSRTHEQQTGVVDQPVWDAVHYGPVFRPRRADNGTHAEIYLDLQAMIVFTDNAPTLITHISSGTGETWCALIVQDTDDLGQPLPQEVQRDVCGVSRTPGGVFKFYRRDEGNRQGPLGGMRNPVYFNYGIGVYGAQEVPARPASHGGIRIPMAIADYFPSLVKNGDPVYVWDGVKEPEQQRTQDMLPTFNYPNPTATTVGG